MEQIGPGQLTLLVGPQSAVGWSTPHTLAFMVAGEPLCFSPLECDQRSLWDVLMCPSASPALGASNIKFGTEMRWLCSVQSGRDSFKAKGYFNNDIPGLETYVFSYLAAHRCHFSMGSAQQKRYSESTPVPRISIKTNPCDCSNSKK